jgi:arabinan endo-1,5-alpha-L-arabinosidase
VLIHCKRGGEIMPKTNEIRIRDPFILTVNKDNSYFLYGTTDENAWDGKGTGFDVYKSRDLENWEGPFPAFRPASDFWADHHFWAPEVYFYEERYYMFATFKAEGKSRGTQILVSDDPLGPFIPLTEAPVTPKYWECLDGTLFIDENNEPWMVFCHEWLQVQDGEMCAIRLSKNLQSADGDPIILFRASEAGWTSPVREKTEYITDGPFLYRNEQGELLMLWSSKSTKGYAVGVSRSQTGNILGPWIHENDALLDDDGGHAMLFKTFNGELMLTIHAPNETPFERPVFISVEEQDGIIITVDQCKQEVPK